MNIILNKKGFTLVELLIALAISGIVLASIYTAFQSQQNSYIAQDQVSEMQQSVRAGLDMMLREIRLVGYDPDDLGGVGIVAANSTFFSFSLVADNDGEDNDNDGTTDENGEIATISYDLYDAYGDGDMDVGRLVGANPASKRALVENVDNLEFQYVLDDDSVTLAPTAIELAKIRSVRVSILVRTERRDENFTSTQTYLPASNDPFFTEAADLTGTIWGPFTGTPTENNRRRLLKVTVNCRNMGL